MGKGPKKQDYEPSEADKASASVALAEYQYFKQKYDPLLQKMRDKSMVEDPGSRLRGRASADVMQALTSDPNYRSTQLSDLPSDMNKALQGQQQQATAAGKNIQNTMRTNVLGTARGQAADAQTGMAQAARLGTSKALASAAAKQQERDARLGAASQLIFAAGAQGMDNLASGGSFFRPMGADGKPVTGFMNRYNYAIGRTPTTPSPVDPDELLYGKG